MSDFELLVRTHMGAVCATAYAVMRDRARSEEIAQDAFLIAWRKLPAMTPSPPLPAWICGIARNLARNASRKRREVEMSDSELITTATPRDDVLSREERTIAELALAKLADDDREVVVMYYRGEQSIAEVAHALGITEAAARQRLHRGRSRLRDAALRVEATLRSTRPGPAFTAACVAALAAGIAPSAEAASGTTVETTRSSLLVAAGVATIVAVGVLGASAWSHSAGDTAERVPAHATEATSATGSPRRLGSFPTLSPSRRASLLAQIRAARQQYVAAAGAGDAQKVYDFAGSALDELVVTAPPPPGPLSKHTLRYAIAQSAPLLRECRGSSARGTLVIEMQLVGDSSEGTIVEEVAVTGEPPLSEDAALVECVRETWMALELPPMQRPEQWKVIYPLRFGP